MKPTVYALMLPFLLALGCGPAPQVAGVPAQYGGLRDPFGQPAPAVAEPAQAPEPPATPAPSAPAPAPSNHCGPACALCSRASEACDEEVRRTGAWDGAQCKRKKQVCDPLVALQNATSCSCD